MKSFVFTIALAITVSFSVAAEKENKAEAKIEKSNLVTLSGKVVDKSTNEALTGVKVVLEGTGQVAYTDFDGKYTLTNIEAGKYNITASYISYENTSVENVSLSLNKSQVDFSLRTAD